MSDQKYILVTGNGRSGTNWVLDILNMSPLTHCRNEPHRISTSPFHITTKCFEDSKSLPDIADIWETAAAWTASTFGERDPYNATSKHHVHAVAQSLKLSNLLLSLRRYKVSHLLIPRLRQAEWSMPWWVGDKQKLREASAVFKIINTDPKNIIWLLENRPNVPIIHVVRHPGGRLNSWLARFLSTQNKDEILVRNQARLHTLQTIDPEWSTNFSDIESMDLVETEVWLWRYSNEKIYQAGQQHKQYTCLVYEQITQDPLGYAEKIYDLCNIPIDNQIRERITQRLGQSVWGKLSGSSTSVADAWKIKLSAKDIEIVNRILKESLMSHWWS